MLLTVCGWCGGGKLHVEEKRILYSVGGEPKEGRNLKNLDVNVENLKRVLYK